MSRTELYHGLFQRHTGADGQPFLSRHDGGPHVVPCPTTGRLLRVATLDANSTAICPACAARARGGFVSFESDLRIAYACPECRQLIWTAGL